MSINARVNSINSVDGEIEISVSIIISESKSKENNDKVYRAALEIHAARTADNAREKIIRLVKCAGQMGCTRRDLMRATGLRGAEVDRLCADLVVNEDMRFRNIRTAGRPRQAYVLPLPDPVS